MMKYWPVQRNTLLFLALAFSWFYFIAASRALDAFSSFFLAAAIAVAIVSILSMRTPVPVGLRSGVLCLVFIIVALKQSYLSPVTGPDSLEYLASIRDVPSLELLRNTLSAFDLKLTGMIPSRLAFPALLQGLTGGWLGEVSQLIIVLNMLLWSISVLVWVRAIGIAYHKEIHHHRLVLRSLFVLLMLSPSALYWSGSLNKDIFVTAFIMLAAALLFQKRYFSGLTFFFLSALLRPYAPVHVLILMLLLHKSEKGLWAVAFAAITALLWITDFSFSAIANVPAISLYQVLSPNPLEQKNWVLIKPDDSLSLPLLFTLEGVFVFFLIAVATVSSKLVRARVRLTRIFILSVLISGITLTAVGYYNYVTKGGVYSFGVAGDTFARKKLGAWPAIMFWVAVSLSRIMSALNRKNVV